jgi:hypothetical protein
VKSSANRGAVAGAEKMCPAAPVAEAAGELFVQLPAAVSTVLALQTRIRVQQRRALRRYVAGLRGPENVAAVRAVSKRFADLSKSIISIMR